MGRAANRRKQRRAVIVARAAALSANAANAANAGNTDNSMRNRDKKSVDITVVRETLKNEYGIRASELEFSDWHIGLLLSEKASDGSARGPGRVSEKLALAHARRKEINANAIEGFAWPLPRPGKVTLREDGCGVFTCTDELMPNEHEPIPHAAMLKYYMDCITNALAAGRTGRAVVVLDVRRGYPVFLYSQAGQLAYIKDLVRLILDVFPEQVIELRLINLAGLSGLVARAIASTAPGKFFSQVVRFA